MNERKIQAYRVCVLRERACVLCVYDPNLWEASEKLGRKARRATK